MKKQFCDWLRRFGIYAVPVDETLMYSVLFTPNIIVVGEPHELNYVPRSTRNMIVARVKNGSLSIEEVAPL